MCKYWWLSFADAELPEGKQFLGAIVTRGHDFMSAIKNSRRLRLNPGGEVLGVEIPERLNGFYKPYENLLLNRADCEKLDRIYEN